MKKGKKRMQKGQSVYLDFAGATPISEKVKKAMIQHMDIFYNPSSLYKKGVEIKKKIEDYRRKIAELIGARSSEIFFTSTGTEANNLAIQGIAKEIRSPKNSHILVSSIEHASVLEPIRALSKSGFDIEMVAPDEKGIIDPQEIRRRLRKETVLVSCMLVNNEVGVINPIRDIAKEIRHARKINGSVFPYFHCDASQAMSFMIPDVAMLGVDLLTLDSSKCFGPKGGVLFKKASVTLSPLIYGGGQEEGLRSGTENLVSIVGISEALLESAAISKKESARLEKLQMYFEKKIISDIKHAEINIKISPRSPTISSVYVPGMNAEFALFQMDKEGVMCATSSACSSNKVGQGNSDTGSYVIDAIYGASDPARKNSTLRFSFSRTTTKSDLDFCLSALSRVLYKQWITSLDNR